MTARPELHNLFAATGEDGARPGRQGDHHGRSQHQVDELRLQLPGWKYWRRKRNSQRQQVESSRPDFLDFKVSSQDPDTAWPGLRLQCPLPWRDRNVYEQRGALHDSPLRQWCGHGQRDPGQPHVCHLLQRLCTEASQAAGHRGRLFRAGEVPGRGSWAEGGILYTWDSGQYYNSHTEYNNCNVLALTSLLDTITVLYSAVLCTHCTTIILSLCSCLQAARNRVRVETLILRTSPWSQFAQYGARLYFQFLNKINHSFSLSDSQTFIAPHWGTPACSVSPSTGLWTPRRLMLRRGRREERSSNAILRRSVVSVSSCYQLSVSDQDHKYLVWHWYLCLDVLPSLDKKRLKGIIIEQTFFISHVPNQKIFIKILEKPKN